MPLTATVPSTAAVKVDGSDLDSSAVAAIESALVVDRLRDARHVHDRVPRHGAGPPEQGRPRDRQGDRDLGLGPSPTRARRS